MAAGEPSLRSAAKTASCIAFCLAGVLGGTALYLGNLSYVTGSDEAARAASRPVVLLHPEVTDNRLGTDVFSDPTGSAVTKGPASIPFGAHVEVSCWAANDSGMTSINAFYLIATHPWQGDYAPANTFLNADTTGTLDPRVPPCAEPPDKLHSEVTYNRLGTDVFSDPTGSAVTKGPASIPFGTHVEVSCWAANDSGMTSINAFYLIATHPWQGDYAPANTFLNADTTGTLDPHVPPCPSLTRLRIQVNRRADTRSSR
jgi:hypothetical protein